MLIKEKAKKTSSWTGMLNTIKSLLRRETVLIGHIVEMLIIAIVVELIIQKSGADRYLLSVDLRQLVIVLLSCTFGVKIGLLSALTESLFIVCLNMYTGLTWKIQLFNPDNWLKISVYFFVACIIGILSDSYQNRIALAKREKEMAEEKYQFLNGIYNDTLHEKERYKQTLVSARGDYERITRMIALIHQVKDAKPWARLCRIGEQALDCPLALYQVNEAGAVSLLAQSANMEKLPYLAPNSPFATLVKAPIQTPVTPTQLEQEKLTLVMLPAGTQRLIVVAQSNNDVTWLNRFELFASLCVSFLPLKQEANTK